MEKKGEIMVDQKPRREQLYPWLTKAKVREELLTISRTGPEAQARAHTRIWRRQERSWQPKNLTKNNFVLG